LTSSKKGFKSRLRERFSACDGDAIFLKKLSRRQRAVVATLGDKVCDFVARNSTH